MTKDQIAAQVDILRKSIKDDKPEDAIDAALTLMQDALVCLNMIAGRHATVSNVFGPSTVIDALSTVDGQKALVNLIKKHLGPKDLA